MHQIAYASRATIRLSESGLADLCEKSSDWNERSGVTGLLVFDRVRYMQVIEGETLIVQELMARIAADCRHDKIVYVIDGSIKVRAFVGWALACVGYKDITTPRHFLESIKDKVHNVSDVKVKAALIGFAALAK